MPLIATVISAFIKVGEIGMVMVAGSDEDERGLSAIDLLKNRCRNRHDKHLELCMRGKATAVFQVFHYFSVDCGDCVLFSRY